VVEAEFGGGMMRGPLDDWARRVEDAAS
jgi:hypothetical protein